MKFFATGVVGEGDRISQESEMLAVKQPDEWEFLIIGAHACSGGERLNQDAMLFGTAKMTGLLAGARGE